MKIALFTDADVFAGTERHILDLATALRAQGCAAEILCPAKGVLAERARPAGVPVDPVEKGGALDWRAILHLRRRFRQRELDLVHSHNGRTALAAAVAAVLAGRGRTVTTQHFLDPARTKRRGWRGWLAGQLHGWVLRQAGRIVAISQAVRQTILERREAAPAAVTTVWNGIADPAALPLRPRAEVRAQFGIPAEAPLVVCAARLEPEKRVDLLIEAMKTVAAAVPGVRCLVAGEGRQQAALQAQIESAGLGGVVQLTGFQSDVLSLMRAADLFVLASTAEPFGLSLVEAMALGIPVVATRAGGPVEILEDGAGLLVSSGNAEELAAAMQTVLQDRPFAEEQQRRGRARFEERFTAPRMAAAMRGIYEAVLNRTLSR